MQGAKTLQRFWHSRHNGKIMMGGVCVRIQATKIERARTGAASEEICREASNCACLPSNAGDGSQYLTKDKQVTLVLNILHKQIFASRPVFNSE